MTVSISKIIGVCLGAVLLAIGFFAPLEPPPGLRLYLLVIVGVLFVCSHEPIGGLAGRVGTLGHRIEQETSGCFVAGVRWSLLLGVPAYYYFVARHVAKG